MRASRAWCSVPGIRKRAPAEASSTCRASRAPRIAWTCSAVCVPRRAGRCCVASSRRGASETLVQRWSVAGRRAARAGPLEQVDVAAHAVDIAHGLRAAREAVCGLHIPLLLGEQRQELAHLVPGIRIAAGFLG